MQTRNEDSKTKITHIVSIGDSLGDRGTMFKRTLFGIPLRYLIGLNADSPKGRFTNGYTWNDYFGSMLASMFIVKEHEKIASSTKHPTAPAITQNMNADCDLADDIISRDFAVISSTNESYSLNDDLVIDYQNEHFLRSFEEGGLTAHDYREELFSLNVIAREIVSNLTEKRTLLLEDDIKRKTTQNEKDQTLVTELSGANDLVTVNSSPDKNTVDKAIAARIENVKILIENGYKNFALINLPDLSLTPKIKALSSREQENIHECVNYFNEQLKMQLEKLKADNENANINLFDIAPLFNDIMQHPARYELDPDKQNQAFTKSPDFNNKNSISHASGYTFWDSLHPTTHVHAIIAEQFYLQLSQQYHIMPPPSSMSEAAKSAKLTYENIMAEYWKLLNTDKTSIFGNLSRSELPKKLASISFEGPHDPNYMKALGIILNHAKNEGGERTKAALKNLGYLNAYDKANPLVPALAEAERRMDYRIDVSTTVTHSPYSK